MRFIRDETNKYDGEYIPTDGTKDAMRISFVCWNRFSVFCCIYCGKVEELKANHCIRLIDLPSSTDWTYINKMPFLNHSHPPQRMLFCVAFP